jgi:hypothetical protein
VLWGTTKLWTLWNEMASWPPRQIRLADMVPLDEEVHIAFHVPGTKRSIETGGAPDCCGSLSVERAVGPDMNR